jgi:hypothetical protein
MNERKSQAKLILRYLARGRTLTALQALPLFGCMRLGARIRDLRKAGYPITTEPIRIEGKRLARYRLR